MSLTSNFDFCVELGIASVKEIFHLAFKSEDRYPHNIGPFTRTLSGRTFEVQVRVLDDEDDPADLSFADEKHILFSFPFEITAETPDAPDPSLSRITLRTRIEVPALLTSWAEDGQDVLGLSFEGVTAAAVNIVTLEGLPTVDIDNVAAAVHSRYDLIPHTYTLGANILVLYDDTRDASLSPPNAATPFDITVALVTDSGSDYLHVTVPIYVDVDLGSFGTYLSYGRTIFFRELVRTDVDITIDMGAEPTAAHLATTVELDNAHPARNQVITQLTPLVRNQLAGFGIIREPALSDAAARDFIRAEVASYLQPRRYPVYSPDSGDPAVPLSTPVGFLLVAPGVLAILMNRRDATVSDHAPDNFLASHEVALAVGRAKVDEILNQAINDEFPGVNDGGHEVSTDEGDATLFTLSVVPADAGDHGESVGHLWASGEAEVHIDCWPDPDVSFEGPIYINTTSDTDEGCSLIVEATAGDFDIDQSCCDVFLDLIIPIVGWVMLAVIESTIDEVGGELIDELTEAQGAVIAPIPPEIKGFAEVSACLTGLTITSGGFIFPGDLSVRRLGRSYEDLEAASDRPRP